MGTLVLACLLKALAALPRGVPAVRAAFERWAVRSAVRDAEKERDLWLRARWDLGAAQTLRRRLVREAESCALIRKHLSRLFEEHPEFIPVHEKQQQRADAAIKRLDDTVRRIYGPGASAA